MRALRKKIWAAIIVLAMIAGVVTPFTGVQTTYADEDYTAIAENLVKEKPVDIGYKEGITVKSYEELYAACSYCADNNTKKVVIRVNASEDDKYQSLMMELMGILIYSDEYENKYGQTMTSSCSSKENSQVPDMPITERQITFEWTVSSYTVPGGKKENELLKAISRLLGSTPIEVDYKKGMLVTSPDEVYAILSKRIKKGDMSITVEADYYQYYMNLIDALFDEMRTKKVPSYQVFSDMSKMDAGYVGINITFLAKAETIEDTTTPGRDENGNIIWINADKKKSKKELLSIKGEAKLFRKSETLYIGEKDKVKVLNLQDGWTAKYSSSQKDVASIDKDGVVTAKKAGETTIKVTISAKGSDSKSFSMKIKVENSNVTKVNSASSLRSYLTNGKGGHIQLTGNITGVNDTIEVKTGNYVIDLNGYSISGKTSMYPLIFLKGATVLFRDSSVNTKGSVDKGYIANTGGADAVGMDKGNLTIDGGQYSAIVYAVNIAGGKTIINDGTFNICGLGFESLLAYGTLTLSGGDTTINGGKFTSDDDINSSTAIEVMNGDINLTINGGYYESDYVALQTPFYADKNINIEVNYGYFKCNGACWAMCFNSGNILINYATLINEDAGALRLTGGDGKTSLTINDIYIYSKDVPVEAQQNVDLIINKATVIHPAREEDGYVDEGYENDYGDMADLHIWDSFEGKLYYREEDFTLVDNESKSGLGIDKIDEFKLVNIKYKDGMQIKNANELYSLFWYTVEHGITKYSFITTEKLYKTFAYYEDEWANVWNSSVSCVNNIKYNHVKDRTSDKVLVTIEQKFNPTYQIDLVLRHPKLKKLVSKKAKKYAKYIKKVCDSNTNSKMTDKEKVTAIHDYMCKTFKYDYDFLPESYWPNGIIDNKKGVCQGYSYFFQLCMNYLGIECYCYRGYMCSAPGKYDYQGHQWNCVKLDGSDELLYIDVTSDDGVGSKKFFLKNAEEFFGMGYHI